MKWKVHMFAIKIPRDHGEEADHSRDRERYEVGEDQDRQADLAFIFMYE